MYLCFGDEYYAIFFNIYFAVVLTGSFVSCLGQVERILPGMLDSK